MSTDRSQPGLTPGQLAQAVQISEFPFRYDEAESIARKYLNEAIARNSGSSYGGSGGSANVGTAPSSGSGSSASPPASSAKCTKTYKVVKGDSCSKLANAGGLSLSAFIKLNSNLNSGCTNLQVRRAFLV